MSQSCLIKGEEGELDYKVPGHTYHYPASELLALTKDQADAGSNSVILAVGTV